MSTAKSMANSYLNAKRLQQQQQQATSGAGNKIQTLSPARFKSSTSNLMLSGGQQAASKLAVANGNSSSKLRLKSTSMSNLTAGSQQQQQQQDRVVAIQRPASRNALDSIHNGMNAKYAQVQSKVLLQNIRPNNNNAASSKIPSNSKTSGLHQKKSPASGSTMMKSDRAQLLNKLKQLQEEAERAEQEREALKLELEREKADKLEQVQQIKLELQEKLAEHDKQNEDYHQKLLEAYELADQNRRAADSVLAESRQRDEESRKKIEELELQLNELKEFVSMKEEMTGKMFELREQLREERERYEEQLKNLHQVFENEKISFNGAKQNMLLDQNSNYFNRMKPNLESNESINKLNSPNGQKCCLSGSSSCSAQHLNQADIYGSKLSTRMKGQARSAWRASKQFASSVITGGVGLSACRQCTKRPEAARARGQAPVETLAFNCRPTQDAVGEFVGFNSNSNHDDDGDDEAAEPAQLEVEPLPVPADQEQQKHTSVIQLDSGCLKTGLAGQDSQLRQQQQQQQQQNGGGLIKVDANNKLTIVTKFQELDGVANGNSAAASSNVSERSRCESSSSGRGTSSSEADSADSQNGDSVAEQQTAGAGSGQLVEPDKRQQQLTLHDDHHQQQQQEKQAAGRSHKRRSSLFKASKVFGGSQASLSKLRSFFSAAGSKQQQSNGNSKTSTTTTTQNTGVDSSLDHLESSRLRCMELNQALKVASNSADDQQQQQPGDSVVFKAAEQLQVQSEVGQGDANEDEQLAELGKSVEQQHRQQQQQQPVLAG